MVTVLDRIGRSGVASNIAKSGRMGIDWLENDEGFREGSAKV